LISEVDEAHFRSVSNRLLSGSVVPFLGAGINLCERPDEQAWAYGKYLPDSRELAVHLAGQLDYPGQDRDNLLRVSQYLDVKLGIGPVYETLHDVFDADYDLTPVHLLLASLPELIRQYRPDGPRVFPLYVTTNYDDGLERAFQSVDEPYDLVTYIAEGPQQGKFLHTAPDGSSTYIMMPNTYTSLKGNERPVIAKIHGAVGRTLDSEDSFVVTENHYISYLSRTEISQLIPINISKRLMKSHFLFMGYSLRDWNLRVILQRIWSGGGLSYRSWAIQPGPERIDEQAWMRQGVELLDARLLEYTQALELALKDQVARGPQR